MSKEANIKCGECPRDHNNNGWCTLIGTNNKAHKARMCPFFKTEDCKEKEIVKEPWDNEEKQLREGFKVYRIALTEGNMIQGTYKHRPDLEKTNWHYYEREDGKIVHIRKDKMIFVEEL
jgi:hypothetical protein